jgi:LysM repeat protein
LVLGGIVAALLGAIVGIGIVGEAEADMATVANMSAPQSIVAQPGDTLWAIARRIVPEGNIVDLVDELVRLNGQTIQAGQVVRLPG